MRIDGFAGVVSGACPAWNSLAGLHLVDVVVRLAGSCAGAGAASAAGMSTMPQPLAGSKPGGSMSRALAPQNVARAA